MRLKRALQRRELAKETIVSGPAGTGKTWGVLAVLHCLLSDYADLRALVVRKTRKAITESVLVTYEQGILPADSATGVAQGSQRRVRQSYRYPNGSEMVVAGLDDPEKIKSSEWDVIYANECTELSENDWEFLASRLDRPGRASRLGYLWGDCNPDAPTHWIQTRATKGLVDLWITSHEANPRMFDGRVWTAEGQRYLDRLEGLTGVRYLRLRKGLWAGAEGQIYEEFDPAVHLVEPTAIPPEWRRFRAIDFGYTNPFVCQWWAVDPDGRLHLYRECYGTGRLVSDWAAEIKRLEGWDTAARERIDASVADWDAEGRATLESCGIVTRPAHKSVREGIEAVQARLRRAGDGTPRLFIHRGCRVNQDTRLADQGKPTCTADEIAGYVWAPAVEGRAVKEDPLKLNDHGMDAMRYMVAYLDMVGSVRIQAL